jgi:MazG family protein
MQELLNIMERLRDPENGCPWDLKQTLESIVPYTIEETYEVADAIRRGDMRELRDELGDLLFQVVFYAQLAKEQEAFDFTDVVAAIRDKMLRRHPHVFGDAVIANAEEQRVAWERHKTEERAKRSVHGLLDGVARSLPALLRAEKLQRRAAKIGFDWSDHRPVAAKVAEELDELRTEIECVAPHERLEEEVGDLLFACVNLARHAGVNPEQGLDTANRKFERRFRFMERQLQAQGRDLESTGLEELDRLWDLAKQREREPADRRPSVPPRRSE